MANSIDDRSSSFPFTLAIGGALAALLTSACSLPSKGEALEIVKRDVKEDADCTLPLDILATLKSQHATKAACVPKEGPASDKTQTCMDALVVFGATTWMTPGYMTEWPDDVASRSLADLPAYERRARNLIYRGCVAMSAELREGRFKCGTASAERVIEIVKKDDTHANIRYARTLTLDPKLAEIERVCGTVSRPPGESTAEIERNKETKQWSVQPASASH